MNVIVGESAAVFQLLAGKNQTLLIGWDPFLILDLGFHAINRVTGFHIQGNCFPGKRLDKNLKNMDGRVFEK